MPPFTTMLMIPILVVVGLVRLAAGGISEGNMNWGFSSAPKWLARAFLFDIFLNILLAVQILGGVQIFPKDNIFSSSAQIEADRIRRHGGI